MAIALYFGGSIAMHVFQQDAIVSAVRLSALCLILFQRIVEELAAPCLQPCIQCKMLMAVFGARSWSRHTLAGCCLALWPYIWSCVIMKVSSHIECSSKHLSPQLLAGLSVVLRSDHLHLQRACPILDHSLPMSAASHR